MKRLALGLAACCLTVAAGALLCLFAGKGNSPSGALTTRQAEQRYFQSRPAHWRACLLQH
jgi:hypothetical protein